MVANPAIIVIIYKAKLYILVKIDVWYDLLLILIPEYHKI